MYGALRVRASRWPDQVLSDGSAMNEKDGSSAVFELCYTIAPLEGIWGEVSRYMLMSSRFLARNDSKKFAFELKQTGASNSIVVRPGESAPFHWSDCRRPKLVSVRPLHGDGTDSEVVSYSWSGGFDPLTIGAVPLRIRCSKLLGDPDGEISLVRSIKMEAEIRPRTGGTGINLLFEEEDPAGNGSLFRIENWSTHPIWISQDGVLANPSSGLSRDGTVLEGYKLRPLETSCYALDVPFRQGKYSGRQAATMAELLRLRLGLAPLTTRAGIETTKVISLAQIGARVRLNPSKLLFLSAEAKEALRRVRILGVVSNDGPTTVLSLS